MTNTVIALSTAQLIENMNSDLELRSSSGQLLLAINRNLTSAEFNQINESVFEIVEKNSNKNEEIKHSFGGGHWYGGPQLYCARWPISNQSVVYQQYVSDDHLQNSNKVGAILERYWLNSNGVAIWVENMNTDFNYGLDSDTGIILIGSQTELRYVVCSKGNARETHEYMIDHYFKKPTGIPDEGMFVYPIWSTWAKYKIYINESIITGFAREIREHGFKDSQLEIDDTFTTNYGDHIFDETRFPNPRAMLKQIKEMEFRVTVWVHPFVNVGSQAFLEGVERGYLIMDEENRAPGLIRWWQGVGAMIDMFNEDAVQWYCDKLDRLKQLGIDSFKFDAGEATYMPKRMKYNCNEMTKRYVEVVSGYGGMIETRAAYRNQDSPTFVRMFDKHSVWGFENGLKTMIPSALHMSIIGYHFQIPDMIGGNAMGEVDWYAGEKPDKELYIRWFQLNAFLPSMQISICPWQYDEETMEIARRMVKLHEEYVAPKIIELSKKACIDGRPVIRPMWWIEPNDERLWMIEDQFMIGDTVLVAPVVDEGLTQRDVYLSAGIWKNMDTGDIIPGRQTIGVPVTIETIPYFQLVEKN